MPDPQGGRLTVLAPRVGSRTNSPGQGFTFYGPGKPIPPVTEGQAVRQWDFFPGFNTATTPRHNEPFSFANLRAFANVELVRMAIETRKDQLARLDHMVKPKDNKAARAKERDPRCVEVERFLAKPDGVTLFPDFMRAVDEDLLALDAPCMEKVRTRGGKLYGLEYVDGATINLLVDEQGRRPRDATTPAFQQIARGTVWANLTNRDLLYVPRNVRSGHIYGFGPVEQLIVTINIIIRRQGSQLAYFTEGNIPAGFMTAPEGWENQAIKDLQEWFDQALSGNIAAQRKILWGPHGATYTAFKDAPLKDEYDEWLARNVAFAFSLPPTPFVRQMNRATGETDQDRAEEEGLEPLKLWRKRWIDDLIATEFGYDDLEFAFREDVELAPKDQVEIEDKNLRNGSSTIDEVRDRRGEDPLPNGLGAKPMIYLGDTPILLESVEALNELKANPPAPVIAPPNGDVPPNGKKPPKNGKKTPLKPGEKPAPGSKKKPAKSEKLSKAEPRIPADHALALSIDRPKAARAIAALVRDLGAILKKAGIDAAAQVERRIEKGNETPEEEAEKILASIDLSGIVKMRGPIVEEIEEIAKDAGQLALASVGVDEQSNLVDQVFGNAVDYARARGAELFGGANADADLVASTREQLRGILTSGLEQNIGRDAIAESIQNATAFSEYRAQLIANTEIAFANSAGKKLGWDAVQADGATMMKEWHASGEEGVCDECEGNEAQGEIAYDEAFESGDDMEPAHPQCRCVTTARVLEPNEVEGEQDSGEE
jgi:hypothetical protein